MTLRVGIHQPNFLPWLGYFDKIRKADVFVLLDDVQFSRGTVTNRVRVRIGDNTGWLSVPTTHSAELSTIAATRIPTDGPWRRKLLATLRASYGRARHFQEGYALVEETLSVDETSLARFNVEGVRRLCRALGLSTELVLSSSITSYGKGTERLVSIVRALGGTAYVCGGGATGYQRDDLFREANIEVVEQRFTHPAYPQHGCTTFVAGLSSIDAVMNLGTDGTAQLLRGT